MRNLKKAIDMIKEFEGLVLHAYKDTGGVWTIGYGHTKNVQPGQVITKAQADAYFDQDFAVVCAAVDKDLKVKLNDNQYGAILCFIYNVGEGILKGTGFAAALNKGDFKTALAKHALYIHDASGKAVKGLIIRRQKEADLFNTPVIETAVKAVPPAEKKDVSPPIVVKEEAPAGFWSDLIKALKDIFTKPVAKTNATEPTIVVSEPDRPTVAPVIAPVADNPLYKEPKIVVVPAVKFNTHGKYLTKSGRNKGLVVHYTVSGRTADNAKGVLKYLASQGYGCPVMDEDGVIYVAGNGYDFEKHVTYHAGKSVWKGVSGISFYNIGMEICNWGIGAKVGPTRTIISHENQKAGTYQAYTAAQEAALENFIIWQCKTNPEFSLDWVVGHDEIAPQRKSDPGGSLSMSMPDFRKKLKAKLGGA